jgi:4-hydroxybenzoyl-CoA reductase alpha subunit
MATTYSVIGKDTPNYDGVAKVTGQAQYTFDLTLPRMLWGKILRSPYPHARIISIDTSQAEKLVGVKAVITGKDTLGIKHGCWRRYRDLCDEEGLCTDKVRFIGDPVAAVAAIDEDVAEEALDLIEVEYEMLPAVFDPREAEKEGAPVIHDKFPNNVNVSRAIEWGDLERGFAESDVIREDRFVLQPTYHACMEVHNSVASFDGHGRLTVWTSTGTPYYIQCLLAETLGMAESDVRVIMPYVGGGFGGKNELFANEFCSALLSKHTGRPVKIVLTREEDMTTTRRRIPMYYYVKIGAKKDGTLMAKEARVVSNGGAYTSMNATGLYLTGWFSSFPYTYPNYKYYGYKVYTNEVPSSSMRGFGAPQAVFAGEQQIEMLAEELGMDSIDLRRKNGMYPGYEVPKQAYIGSCGLHEALDKMQDYLKTRGPLPKDHGIGLACFGFNSGGVFNWFDTPYAFSSALIKMNIDGKIDLHNLAAEVGQGTTTTMAMLCAESLGVGMEDVRVHTGDTTLCSTDLGAWASRQTMMMGNAIRLAADEIRKQLFETAAGMMRPNMVYDFDMKDRKIFLRDRPDRWLPLEEVTKVAVRARNGLQLIGRGLYTPHGKGMISPAFSFGIQAVEVKVDRETGRYQVVKVATAHDSGKIINPMAVRGQLEGAIQMSIGYGFSEEMPSEDGRILNPNLVDYKIIRYRDMPRNETLEIAETYEPEGPFGAKEAGEGLTCPTAGAMANAIYNAVGVRITDNPVTPEKVWRALKGVGEAEAALAPGGAERPED